MGKTKTQAEKQREREARIKEAEEMRFQKKSLKKPQLRLQLE